MDGTRHQFDDTELKETNLVTDYCLILTLLMSKRRARVSPSVVGRLTNSVPPFIKGTRVTDDYLP